jgi:hypothetical protein
MVSITSGYVLPKDKTSEYLILFCIIFLIIISWSLILYRSTEYSSSNVKALEVCQKSYCPTNRLTGEKRCSKDGSIPLQYDPIFEVCNPIKGCVNDSTPYAVQTDGSTNLNGICDVDGCRCVNYLSSPEYTQVIFNMQNGNIYSQYATQQGRVVFKQNPTSYVGQGNLAPMYYKDPSTQFYEISPSLLSYVTPVCPKLQIIPEPNDLDYVECINSNPCIVGKMAYIPKNSSEFINFNVSDLSGGVPLACVSNTVENPPDPENYPNSCISSVLTEIYAPVFNTITGQIKCFQLS